MKKTKTLTLKEILEDCLTSREIIVIEMRFGLGGQTEKTLQQIGSNIGVCRERVRQIINKALRKVRYKSKLKKYELPLNRKPSVYSECIAKIMQGETEVGSLEEKTLKDAGYQILSPEEVSVGTMEEPVDDPQGQQKETFFSYQEIETLFKDAKSLYDKKDYTRAANRLSWIIKKFHLYSVAPNNYKHTRLLANIFLYYARCGYFLYNSDKGRMLIKHPLLAYLKLCPDDRKGRAFLEKLEKDATK